MRANWPVVPLSVENRSKKFLRPLLTRRPEYIGRRSLLNYPALIEEADAVGNFAGEAHLMSHQEHGQVVLVREVTYD